MRKKKQDIPFLFLGFSPKSWLCLDQGEVEHKVAIIGNSFLHCWVSFVLQLHWHPCRVEVAS